ncbi:MAG: hypothetical protein MR529_00690 [Cuneatibacter sp.]|nr:hypothetical protein [Cuneatibacter sp.]
MRHRTKWSTYCLAAILAASSLMACAKSPTVSETGVSGYEELDGRVKAQIGEKITVDAELFTQPDRESYEVLHAGFDESGDLNTIVEVIFPGRDDLTVTTSYGSENRVRPPEQNEELMYDDVGHIVLYESYTKSCSSFLGEVDYDMLDQRHRHVETLTDIEDVEVPGYPREQAISEIHEKLQKMGLSVQERPYAMYGISSGVIQAYYEEHDEKFKHFPTYVKPEITEDDSIYCMLWNVEINDTPVVSGNYPREASELCNARGGAERGGLVYVVTTKDRILWLQTELQYSVESKETAEKILPLEEILAAVPKYYENQLLSEERTISRISFCYIPVLTESNEQTNEYHFDLMPGWVMDASYEMPDRDGIYWDIIYINAITGEIIE